jgi:hypothetical protein
MINAALIGQVFLASNAASTIRKLLSKVEFEISQTFPHPHSFARRGGVVSCYPMRVRLNVVKS